MNNNKIIRFDDELKKFIGKKISVCRVNESIDEIGTCVTWDFKHQSLIVKFESGITFIRGSEISSIKLIEE